MSKHQNEVQKIIEFVIAQRDRVSSEKQWKRRLAGFGFVIDNSGSEPMIMTLPHRHVVCALPA